MRRHIALIEDDEVILGNYADFLADLGFEVDRYATKSAALAGIRYGIGIIIYDAAQPSTMALEDYSGPPLVSCK